MGSDGPSWPIAGAMPSAGPSDPILLVVNVAPGGPVSIRPASPDSSHARPPGKSSWMATVLCIALPPVVGLLSFVAQAAWHAYYWGLWMGGTRTPAAYKGHYASIAEPLLYASVLIYLIVAFVGLYLAARRGCGWVIANVIAIVAGGMLLAIAVLAAATGGD
jgi:hypothetical protein